MANESLDNNSLDDPNITISQIDPGLETAIIEHPRTPPQNLNGTGAFVPYSGNPILTAIETATVGGHAWVEDGMTLGSLIEDPKRNRLILLTHNTKTIDGGASGNHAIFMYTVPWGQLGAVAPTRCNPIDNPLIDHGAVGDFDEGLAAQPSGVIIGDRLFIVYAGCRASTTWDLTQASIGLAWVDLTGAEEATPLNATKTGFLQVGGGNHYGFCPTLDYQEGQFFLWVGNPDAGPVMCNPMVPRLYTSHIFNLTTSTPLDWTLHPMFADLGANAADANSGFASSPVYLGNSTWVWSQVRYVSGATPKNYIDIDGIRLESGRAIMTRYGDVMNHLSSASNYDGSRLLYNAGKWYMTYCDFATGSARVVYLATWDEDASYTQDAAYRTPLDASAYSATVYSNSVYISPSLSYTSGVAEYQTAYKYVDAASMSPGGGWIGGVAINHRADNSIVNGWIRIAIFYPTSTSAGPHIGDAGDSAIHGFNVLITGKPI